MDKHSVLQDDFDFLLKFISHPRQIGSIVPSSQYLTDAMLRRVPWDSVHSLVELGAGTGVITCEINRRAPMNCKLISIEQDADMVFLVHRPEYYDREERPGEADVILAKHRNGPTDTITVAFQGHYSRFVDMQA